MNHEYRKARTSALGNPQGPNYPEYPFQGESGYFGGQPQLPVPYNPAPTSGGSGFNFSDIKTMIDRMGGIDGVLNMMQKASKMMQTVQQMAPMFKLLFNSFGSKAKTADAFDGGYPSRRRRRRRKSGSRRRSRSRKRR